MISTAISVSFEKSLICYFLFEVVYFGKILTWQSCSLAHIIVIIRCEWGEGGSGKASTHFVTPYFPFVGRALLHISQQQGNKLNYFLLNTSYVSWNDTIK